MTDGWERLQLELPLPYYINLEKLTESQLMTLYQRHKEQVERLTRPENRMVHYGDPALTKAEGLLFEVEAEISRRDSERNRCPKCCGDLNGADRCPHGDCDWGWSHPNAEGFIECPDPENCQQMHNENDHHYGCECSECIEIYRQLKR